MTDTAPPAVGQPLQGARLACAAAFATQGFVFISLTTRLPRFSDRWDLSEVDLSLLLLMIILLAGLGSLGAERVAHRRESAQTLRAGFLLIAVAVPVLTLAPTAPSFVGGLAAYGVGLGVIDASTNMQGVAVELRYGRPLLPSFHGAWTFGGLVGAGLALATGGLSLQLTAFVALVPTAALVAPYLARDSGDPRTEAGTVSWRPLFLVGLGMVLFYMVDTAAQAWGPVYLEDVFDTPAQLVALATFPYLTANLVMRLAGDGLVRRHGPVRVLRVGAVVAFVGLAIVVSAPTWPVAVLGFTVVGAGVAVIAPLSFSAAARIAGEDPVRVDAVIARFNQFNYVGALIGAVLIGLVGAESLRLGFAVPMVLILLMLPLARAFAPASQASEAPTPSGPGQLRSG